MGDSTIDIFVGGSVGDFPGQSSTVSGLPNQRRGITPGFPDFVFVFWVVCLPSRVGHVHTMANG